MICRQRNMANRNTIGNTDMFNTASEEVPGGGASGFDEKPGE